MLLTKTILSAACLSAVTAIDFTPEQEAFIKSHNLKTNGEQSSIQNLLSLHSWKWYRHKNHWLCDPELNRLPTNAYATGKAWKNCRVNDLYKIR